VWFGYDPLIGKRLFVLSHILENVREGAELFQGDLTQLIPQFYYLNGIKHAGLMAEQQFPNFSI
jgi:hypothetical protein